MSQKILLVDDSEDMRILLRMLFESEGYEIDEANNGKQALAQLTGNSIPDLIFLDHNMPVMSGPEFVKELETKFPKIFARVPIVMLTALDTDEAAGVHATETVNKSQGVEYLLKLAAKYLKQPIEDYL